MTIVHIAPTKRAPDGTRPPASATFRFAPTSYQAVGDEIVAPVAFPATVVNGVLDVDLAPTGPGWAWRIEESIAGLAGRTIYVQVPATGPVNYADLVRIDPATLAPTAPLDPAWAAFAVTPDPSNPGFYLIGNS